MLEAVSGFLSALKGTSPVIFLGVAIASGLILFGTDGFVSNLGLAEFRDQNKGYIGVSFVLSVSIVFAQAIANGGKMLLKFVERWRKKKVRAATLEQRQNTLHKLTADEKAYLKPYVFGDENTQYFLIEDGIAGGLKAKDIIYMSSQVGSMLEGWAYNIQPWAKQYLEENPHLLEGPNPSPQGPRRW